MICQACIQRVDIDALLEWLLKADFFYTPASIKNHGKYQAAFLKRVSQNLDLL